MRLILVLALLGVGIRDVISLNLMNQLSKETSFSMNVDMFWPKLRFKVVGSNVAPLAIARSKVWHA